jgi:Ca2+-binding RTX toxin-like protein
VVITGTSGADTLNGTNLADTISGLGGNDILNGKAGNDVIKGGSGLDKIGGDAGEDLLWGDDGNDQVWGGIGNDVIYGGAGNDSLYGEAGTDTLKGEAGNDILKSGTGLAYLYGGAGNDTLTYDPTASNVKAVGNYLSTSLLNGDAGTDTLHLFNKTTYTSGTGANATEKASHTTLWFNEKGTGYINFGAPISEWQAPTIGVGTFKGIENLTVTGAGGLTVTPGYFGSTPVTLVSITGTAVADTFNSSSGNDTFKGAGGNDTFYLGGGTDTITSENNDADIFHFGSWNGGTTTITGFNGVGTHVGDKIYVSEYHLSKPETQIVESNGKTTFTADFGEKLIVDADGLVEGVDWFWT